MNDPPKMVHRSTKYGINHDNEVVVVVNLKRLADEMDIPFSELNILIFTGRGISQKYFIKLCDYLKLHEELKERWQCYINDI